MARRRRGPAGRQATAFPARKRVKLLVSDRSPSSPPGLRELQHRYHLSLPTGYPACTCLCRLDACPGGGGGGGGAERGARQYLLYKMDDKG